MDRKEILATRLRELGWTEYRLVQEVCKLRAARGEENATVTRYQSSISKAMKDPANVKTYIADDIIEALGGEQVIRWNMPKEVKIER